MPTSFCPPSRPAPHAHTLADARYATLSQDGQWVYLYCGNCGTCYREAVSVWESELRRRAEQAASGTTPAVRHDGFYRQPI
jgi:hypothetical protein